MFVSTRDQGIGRRSRMYGVNRSARSSKLSVLSTASVGSTTSVGSNSTITQDSYSRSRNHNGRTRRKRRIRDDGADMDGSVLNNSLSKEKQKSTDVFDFLVEESTRRNAGDSTAAESVSQRQDDNNVESDPECYYRGHLSDSGISMDSNSTGDSATGESPTATHLPTLLEDASEHLYSSASSVADCVCCQQESQMGWHEVAPGCYHCEQIPPSPASHASFFIPPNPPVHSFTEASSAPGNKTSNSTASPIIFRDKGGSRSTPRLFRRFKKVNSRVLLQMQAKIAELEHELRVMDTRATARKKSNAEKAEPSVKPSPEEQTRREEIYRSLRVRLDQYYQALIATHQVDLITKTPTSQETLTFQKWIDSHILNRKNFPSLTSDELDLACFRSPDKIEHRLSVFRAIALSATINLLIPLLAFKFMAGLLNRLIFWSFVTAAGAMTIEKFALGTERAYTTCIIGFGGMSLGAALILHI